MERLNLIVPQIGTRARLLRFVVESMYGRPMKRSQFIRLQKFLQRKWANKGIRFIFDDHVIERSSRPENSHNPITETELKMILVSFYNTYANQISRLEAGEGGIIRNEDTGINLPFVMNWSKRGEYNIALVIITMMRKQYFEPLNPDDKLYRVTLR